MIPYLPIEGEEWRAIQESNGRYHVSNFGRVRTKRGILSTSDQNGYRYVWILCEGCGRKSVHRLVARLFVEGYDPKLDVNHKDMVKDNNHASNLEWVTHAENIRHGMATSPDWRERLARAGARRRKAVTRTDDNGVTIRYESMADAARALGHINKAGNIFKSINIGAKWYGYTWAYATE